jgi:hypothetical protein
MTAVPLASQAMGTWLIAGKRGGSGVDRKRQSRTAAAFLSDGKQDGIDGFGKTQSP